jgi:hypothetical protein
MTITSIRIAVFALLTAASALLGGGFYWGP